MEARGEPHVEVILVMVIPHQQLVPHCDVCRHHKVEVAAILRHSQVLLHGVSGRLNEIHPVPVLRIPSIDEI